MARRNRAEVVVADEIGVYHCVQRVVRRAFLCGVDPLSGNSNDHRRSWIRDRLESLAGLFGLEIAAFAVLSNHLHVILRIRPDWSPSGPIRRWRGGGWPSSRAAWGASWIPPPPWLPFLGQRPNRLYRHRLPPRPGHRVGNRQTPWSRRSPMLTADPALMATTRGWLSSLSWFMRHEFRGHHA